MDNEYSEQDYESTLQEYLIKHRAPKQVLRAMRSFSEMKDDCLELAKTINQLEAENAKLRAALEWYADTRHYRQRFDPDLNDFTSDVMDDQSARAKAALKGDE